MQLLNPGLLTFFYKLRRNYFTIGQFFQPFFCFAFLLLCQEQQKNNAI